MYNYRKVHKWHLHYDATVSPSSVLDNQLLMEEEGRGGRGGEGGDGGRSDIAIAEITFHRNYIRQKLDNGFARMWRVSNVL